MYANQGDSRADSRNKINYNMVSVENFYYTLRQCGVSMFTGVPDSLLKNLCAYITDNSDTAHNIIAANEGSAVGIAAGHYLATGEVSVVYMQNSGIGNAVNPLMSLADEKVYSMPILLIIGWRGEPGVHDEPQHLKQGEVTLPLLDAMQIPYIILPDEDQEALSAAKMIINDCKKLSKPHAIVIRKNTFGKYKLQKEAVNDYPLSREEALTLLVKSMEDNSIIVSTTGKLSRELFELRETLAQGHGNDFLTVGSMGHSSSIALGIALEKLDRKIFCFDGDGAFIMHMGAITNIGALAPKNFIHVVFNNGAHESVGGQPTLGFGIDICAIARSCGYREAITVSTSEEFTSLSKCINSLEGPALIELRVKINSRDNLGRPTTTPVGNKNAFMVNLNQ